VVGRDTCGVTRFRTAKRPQRFRLTSWRFYCYICSITMRNTPIPVKAPSDLEGLVLEFLWGHGPATAEQVREGLSKRHRMKEATVRTILRRLETKGYIRHHEQVRTYIYTVLAQPENLAMRALRQIIDRFWGGSAPDLVAGMVEHEVIDPKELQRLAKRLEKPRSGKDS
jgi:BlaI family transcriptional regulator, penicillinase repressor